MPKVSVIIPAYIDDPDKIVWFGEALQSVKDQTFTDWEAIIIDDYSPVDIGEIKVRFEADERFRWFRTSHNNGSPATVRNTAVALAESEAILPLDADDMLGSNVTLERLYQAWVTDKTKIVYGNLQRLQLKDGVFTKGKRYDLAEYSFELVIDIDGAGFGVVPVTGLHSIECHQKAGGWKAEFDSGLEDIEYWIAAGEQGFCGRKIHHTTLLYRRHENSRSFALVKEGRTQSMKAKIKVMHQLVFNGRYPMACCGKGKSTTSTNSNLAVRATKVTILEDVRDEDKIWVQYQGAKQGSFELAADQKSPIAKYIIQGKGHILQIHRHDEGRFRSFAERISINGKPAERQSAYIFGIPSPVEPVEEIQVVEATPPKEIKLAEIERFDSVAMATRGIEPEAQPEPAPAVNGPVAIEQQLLTQTYDLSGLGLSSTLQDTLEGEGRTMEWLAAADPADLTPYDRVGIKTAKAIIASAQRAING